MCLCVYVCATLLHFALFYIVFDILIKRSALFRVSALEGFCDSGFVVVGISILNLSDFNANKQEK